MKIVILIKFTNILSWEYSHEPLRKLRRYFSLPAVLKYCFNLHPYDYEGYLSFFNFQVAPRIKHLNFQLT